jgi:TRAP-type C4-dicarboxylate transport system permease small subunit
MSITAPGADSDAPGIQPKQQIPETIVERTCKLLSEIALMVMLVLVAVDIVTRSVFNFSYEVSDEVSAYMLVAIAFLSLSVCQVHGSFHQVELVQARLSERGRIVSRLVFGLLSLAFSALLLWQFIKFEMSSWRFGDRAPTLLETPLWLPRLLLVAGMAALCFSLLRTLAADMRRLRLPAAAGGRANES